MTKSRLAALVSRVALAAFLGSLVGACGADLFGQDDGFHQKLLAGCRTEEDCVRLRAEAQARVLDCEPNTIGRVRCGEANADRARADALVAERRRQEERLAEEVRQREVDEEEMDRQVAEGRARTAQREADRMAHEKAEQELETAWAAVDRAKCSGEGDAVACQALQEFLILHHTSKYGEVGLTTLAQGRAIIEERNRVADEVQAKQEAASAKTRGPAGAGGSRAKCCDGTLSPSCGCGGGKGCCSRHGGVCGCD